jgi:hypothetical protein
MQRTEALLGAMADAARRADQAMREGRVRYVGRLGFARRNLLELFYWYAALTRMRPRPVELAGVRRQLRRAIAVFRRLNIAETRGIDTSVRAAG